jgi:hypothetical protein
VEIGRNAYHDNYLSSRNDDVLTPVLDAYRSIGVHDSQVAAMEITTLESFLGGLVICEILQDPGEMSNGERTKGCCVSNVYLFHHKVSTDDNFANSLPVRRNILEVFAFCLVNDTGAVSGGVAISLPSHVFARSSKGKRQP